MGNHLRACSAYRSRLIPPLAAITLLLSFWLAPLAARGLAHGVSPTSRTPSEVGAQTQPSTSTPTALARRAPTTTVVGLQLANSSVEVGQQVTLDVTVNGAPSVSAFEFTLAYNPSLITPVSVVAGSFLGSSGRTVTLPPTAPLIDSTAGRVTFGAYTTGTQAPASGNGVLATLTLQGNAAGISALSFVNTNQFAVELVDQNGDILPGVSTTGGQVLVASTAAPTATVTATSTSTSSSGVAGTLRFITPVRIIDTRATTGQVVTTGFDVANPTQTISAGTLTPNQMRRFQVAGKTFGSVAGGNQVTFPSDVGGLLLNVTIIQGTPSGGYVTVFPGDANPPTASTVNPSASIAFNFWMTGVPTSGPYAGSIGVFSTNALDIAIDAVGFYAASNPAAPSRVQGPPGARSPSAGSVGNLKFVDPVRIVDTRTAADSGNPNAPIGFDASGQRIVAGPLVGGQPRVFKVGGQTFGATSFPASTAGLMLHITIVHGAPQGGYLTLYPGDSPSPPNASSINPTAQAGISFNFWATGIPTDGPNAGTFAVFSTGAFHLVVDVVGYFSAENVLGNANVVGNPTFVTPGRVLETRNAADSGNPNAPIGFPADGSPMQAAALTHNTTSTYTLAGKSFPGFTVPADVKGILANVTIVQGGPSGGYVTAFPGGTTAPTASTLNPTSATGVNASFWANGIPNGSESVYTTNDLQAIIDIVGYYR